MEEEERKKILFICDKKIFHFFEDYINTFHHIFHVEIYLYTKEEWLLPYLDSTFVTHPLIIFIQSIPSIIYHHIDTYIKKKYKIGLLNTEQLSRKEYALKINSYHPQIYRIDYSEINLLIVANELKKIYLPYQFHPREIINPIKDKDVCMIYPHQSQRRLAVVDALRSRGVAVDFISGFGISRDQQLFRYKILINLHYDDDYQILEELRCNRCIFNRMIVVSEKSLYDDIHMLKRHFLSVPYNEIVDKVVDVVRNYDLYYTHLFESFNALLPIYQKDLERCAIQNICLMSSEE